MGDFHVVYDGVSKETFLEKISALVHYGLQWQKFSQTRWCACGPSSRRFLLGLSVGMEGLYALCEADPNVSMYHLTGFTFADFQVRKFLVVSAVASYPSEAVLLEILKDDRVLRRATELQALMEEQVRYIEALPDYVWKRLFRLLGTCGNDADYTHYDLRHDALESAHTSIAYVFSKLFYIIQIRPFSLTQGDILRNLEQLRAEPFDQIIDPTTRCIYELMHRGESLEYLKRCLELLKDTACSTNLVEQNHASGALLMRHHQTYGERTLRARSTIHQASVLFSDSTFQRDVGKLNTKLDRVSRRQTQVSGFRAFCRTVPDEEVKSILRRISGFDGTRSLTLADRRSVYDSFPKEVKVKFDRESKRLLTDDASEISTAKAALRGQIRDLEQRQRDVDEGGLVNHTSSCKFTDGDVEQLCEIFNELESGRALSNAPLDSPAVPSEIRQQMIIDLEDEVAGERRSLPFWCRHIVANRERWRMVAVCSEEFPTVAFLVLLAVKTPQEVTFLELRRRERLFDPRVAFTVSDDWLPSHFTSFDIHPLHHYTETTVPIGSSGDIFVLPNCRFDRDYLVAGASERFEDFIAQHPPLTTQRQSSSARSKVCKPSLSEVQALLLEFPFLSQADLDKALGKQRSERVKAVRKPRIAGKKIDEDSSSSSEVASASDKDDDLDLDAVGPVFDKDELAALRHDLCDEVEEFTHFYVHYRGGLYIFADEGVVSNSAACMARGAMVKYWCDCYSWQLKYQFHYSVYGQDGANELAKEVCRRGEFFSCSGYIKIRMSSYSRMLIWKLMRRRKVGLTGLQCRTLPVIVSSEAWKLDGLFQ